ncbi:HAD-IB family hydrolase [Hahella sp. KA22]|uniref:histidinol-phosphatase n=1 Tax=Hahella sp. KA22 TaxID=1628392 RepID=UPI000FDE8FC5|nr:HAD family hydrolase [Hahella sp. KA22]AZZ94412.1 HAD family hydrolase [Hahella sp. KA22]QAY57786.1 HAD-IB family hydrolase [Hahella sp. KA22]
MALAIFDLDNTLIAGDSDHAWGDFLVHRGIVDQEDFKRVNDEFYQDYLKGQLDIFKYLEFALSPLTQHPLEQLHQWRKEFVEESIRPLLLPKALELLRSHRDKGDYLLIITATNRFVTQPIADLLEVDELIATEPEFINNRYTGKVSGAPSYQAGKVTRLREWLQHNPYDLSDAYFYSDSHNDIPLLEHVGNPVVVDGDERLLQTARERDWEIMSLRP